MWVFAVVEHWNAECLGYHVTKHGSRFAALAPLALALLKRFGSVERGVAQGWSLPYAQTTGVSIVQRIFKIR